MAGSLSLTVGANTSTVPINATNANINAAILRYCVAKGLDTEGKTAVQIGEMVLTHILKTVRDVSIDRQRAEELGLVNQTIETKVQAENNF